MRSLRRLLPYLRPHRARLVAGLVCVVLSSAVGAAIPWIVRSAVDGLAGRAPVAHAWRMGGLMLLVALVAGALRYVMRERLNGLSRLVEYDLRNDLYVHVQRLDAAWFGRTRTGDVMARLTNDLGAVRMAAGPAIMYLVNTIVGGLFALVFMVGIDPRLTLLALLPMLLLPLMMLKLGRAIHHRFEAVQEQFGTLTTRAQENIGGTRIVRAYRQEGAEVSRFEEASEEYLARSMRLVRLNGFMHPAFGLLAGLGALAVLWYGGTLVMRGRITTGDFVAFGLYLAMLTWPLIALGWVINLFQRGGASMGRLLTILDARPAVTAPATARPLPPRAPGGGRALELRGVGFHYPTSAGEAPRWVLRDVSVKLAAGEVLGIVGATGSGKSALLDLVPRLHDPQEGEILLDGVPIRELSLDELRREIGYAPQESVLFSETIAENLDYGLGERVEGRAPAAAARWASGVAQLDEAVAGFPAGYDTMLGERGINLSGGQRQRAALARALARRPALVLLDDTLSAVDTHTEAAILAELGGALRGRTAVIAAHRISAVRDAHRILVLEEGRVVEEGTHESLVAHDGRYAELLRRQRLEEAIEEAPVTTEEAA